MIENLYISKVTERKKLIKEFPGKGWSVHGLNDLLRKLRDTGTTVRSGSRRRRTARIDDNIDAVNDLVLSKEDAPQTHRSTCQIARETGIQSSVYNIVCKDLRLKRLKKHRVQELTAAIVNRDARYSAAECRRRHCLSVTQKSVLLRGKEWPSL